MKFTHEIILSEVFNSPNLSVSNWWAALLNYIESPLTFIHHAENSLILEKHSNYILRELSFSNLNVLDKIHLNEVEKKIIFETQASKIHHGGQRTIQLIVQENQVVSIVFEYENELPENNEEEKQSVLYLKNIYQMMDLEHIKMMHELILTS